MFLPTCLLLSEVSCVYKLPEDSHQCVQLTDLLWQLYQTRWAADELHWRDRRRDDFKFNDISYFRTLMRTHAALRWCGTWRHTWTQNRTLIFSLKHWHQCQIRSALNSVSQAESRPQHAPPIRRSSSPLSRRLETHLSPVWSFRSSSVSSVFNLVQLFHLGLWAACEAQLRATGAVIDSCAVQSCACVSWADRCSLEVLEVWDVDWPTMWFHVCTDVLCFSSSCVSPVAVTGHVAVGVTWWRGHVMAGSCGFKGHSTVFSWRTNRLSHSF